MDWIKNMTVRNKLFLASGGLLLLMVVLGGSAILQLRHAEELTAQVRQTAIPGIRLAGQMESLLQRKRILVMRLVIAEDESEIAKQEQAVQQLNGQMQTLWRQYEPLVDNEGERAQLDQLQQAFNDYDAGMATRLMPAIRAGDRAQVKAVLGTLTPVAERQSAALDALVQANDQLAATVTDHLSSQNAQAIEVIALLLALAVVIGGGFSVWLARLIVHPLLILGTARVAQALGVEFDPQLLLALVLVAALPGASNVSMMAENYSVDSGRIATITLLSTSLSFVTFAAAVWLLGAAPVG